MVRIAEKYKLTEFGRTVTVIAMEHGLENRTQLLRHLKEHGHEFSTERVGHWLYGRNQVDVSFPSAIRKSLPLTPQQFTRLAVSFLDGQKPG